MTALYIVVGIIAAALLIYLVVALLKPEIFS
jgi:K+-transporting ATPase KdpF subunit